MVDQEQADKYAEAARELEVTVGKIFEKYSEVQGALGAGHYFRIAVEWDETSDKEKSSVFQAVVVVSDYPKREQNQGTEQPSEVARKNLFVYGGHNEAYDTEYQDTQLVSKKLPSPHEAKMDLCNNILERFVENKLCVVSVDPDKQDVIGLPSSADVYKATHTGEYKYPDHGSDYYEVDKVAPVVFASCE